MPDGLQAALLVILGIAAALSVAVLVRSAWRERSAVPVLVLLGTLLCVVYEPLGDMLVLAYYPEQGQVTWVTLFDLPVWTVFTYVAFLFTIAAGVHGLSRVVAPRQQWLIVPAVPALLAAAHVTTSLPAAAALSSSDNPTVILLGALGSIAMSALVVYALGALVGVSYAARHGADRVAIGPNAAGVISTG